jgi:prophage antirepressor-like protein
MNNLKIFNNSEFGNIRTIEINEKFYAVGVDVARALEYANPRKAVIDHCKGIRKLGIPSPKGIQETNLIPEGDIYRLIIKAADQSRNSEIKEKAVRFEKWIFEDVLPQIRKYGAYITPKKLSELENNPNALPQLIRRIQQDKIRIETLQNQVKEQTAKVALANAFLSTGETVTVGEFAKILNSNGVDIGQNRLFRILRDSGLIMKLESSQFNTPTQKATDMKLLRVVRRVNINESGSISFSKTT